MFVNLLKSFSLFFLLFVSFNTKFSTDLAGEIITKIAVAQFMLVYAKDLWQMFFEDKNRVMKAFYFFIAVFMLMTLISNLVYFNGTITVATTRIISMVLVFVYVSYTKELDKVLYMLWVIMLVSSAVAYFSMPLDEYTFRKTGATEDPNEFAAQLLLVMFSTIFLFNRNKNWFFLLGSMGVFTYTLLFAGSKSAFIFMALMLLMSFILKFRTVMGTLFTGKGIFAILLVVGVLSVGVMNSSKAVEGLQGRAKKSGTLQQRLIVWRAGGEMIRDHFYLGVGFGEFSNISGSYIKDYIPKIALPAHNNFIKIFGESGVFSFLSYLFFILVLFFTRTSEILNSEYYWLYVASLSVFLMGLTIPSLHHKDYWIALAILSHVILLFSHKDEENLL